MAQPLAFQACKALILNIGAPSDEFRSECAKYHTFYDTLVNKMKVPEQVARDSVLSKSGLLGINFFNIVPTLLYTTESGDKEWVCEAFDVNAYSPTSKIYYKRYYANGAIFVKIYYKRYCARGTTFIPVDEHLETVKKYSRNIEKKYSRGIGQDFVCKPEY
jgi:hypothetical protein